MSPISSPYDRAPRLPEGDDLDLGALVGGFDGPLELEIGPGRGGFVFERLAAEPGVRFVGLEVRRKWATLVDERLARRGLAGRARVFAEDARDVLPRLRAASVARVFVHFPDPWWKKRHKKRRVVTPGFAEQCVRVLLPGGELFLQTDVSERAMDYRDVLDREPRLQPAGPGRKPILAENPYGARSPREHRAVLDGLPVYRLLYKRACP